MADSLSPNDNAPVLGLNSNSTENQPAPELPKPRSIRRKRSFKIDEEEVVRFVMDRRRKDANERQEWMNKRLDRYAKLRGWLPEKNWPWEGCSNLWVPVLATAAYRVISSLYNAVLGGRPIMQSKAVQRKDEEKQNRTDRLLDYQVFNESQGEQRFDDFINQFVFDGTAIAHTAYVNETRMIVDVHVLPVPPDFLNKLEITFVDFIYKFLSSKEVKVLSARAKGTDSWDYAVELKIPGEDDPITADIEFYMRDDELMEMHVKRKMTIYDGPVFNVSPLENIVVPPRCANLQPPGPTNPEGAPYVNRVFSVRLDEVWNRWNTGIYDMMTDEKWEKLKSSRFPLNSGRQEEQMQEQQDIAEGTQPQQPRAITAEERFLPLNGIEHYGRWVLDKDEKGDGEEVDVIFWVLETSENSGVLVRARYLTEIYPGTPPHRPFAESRFITVPHRFYAIGLLELLEPIQDLTKILFDNNMDWGTIRNMPFFFYRASSGLQPEILRMWPGEGYPLDNPSTDINFPNMGNQNNTWIFNTLSLVQQMGERLMMQSDFSFGRVPSGKASALRTVGTTMALMQQSDVRSEHVLRRLLIGISQIYQMFHRLNRRYLSHTKEFRIAGVPKQGEAAYLKIEPQDIDAEMDFDFKATMLNTNKQALNQALQQAIGLLVSPLALQLKIVTPDEVYRLMRDHLRSNDLDPDSYLKPPSPQAAKPGILAEEAIQMIAQGEVPDGSPLEGTQEHFQKLMKFQQSDEFGYLDSPIKVNIFASYLRNVMMQMKQEMQQQQLMGAAQSMQNMMGQQQQGGGGTPTTIAEPEQPAPMEGNTMMPGAVQ